MTGHWVAINFVGKKGGRLFWLGVFLIASVHIVMKTLYNMVVHPIIKPTWGAQSGTLYTHHQRVIQCNKPNRVCTKTVK